MPFLPEVLAKPGGVVVIESATTGDKLWGSGWRPGGPPIPIYAWLNILRLKLGYQVALQR